MRFEVRKLKLQNLLIKLRGEESIPTAAKRMGISPSYYRNIEKGHDPQRGTKVTPSPATLEKIAKAYKVGYMRLVKAAGYENDPKYNPEVLIHPFVEYPTLQKWYESLPNEDIETVAKLYSIWTIMKGNGKNVL